MHKRYIGLQLQPSILTFRYSSKLLTHSLSLLFRNVSTLEKLPSPVQLCIIDENIVGKLNLVLRSQFRANQHIENVLKPFREQNHTTKSVFPHSSKIEH